MALATLSKASVAQAFVTVALLDEVTESQGESYQKITRLDFDCPRVALELLQLIPGRSITEP